VFWKIVSPLWRTQLGPTQKVDPIVRFLCLFLAILSAPGSEAAACNIPVFRYALERWKPDVCEVLVFYDGPLTPDELASVEKLCARSTEQGGHANTRVIRVDVSSDRDPERVDVWKGLSRSPGVELPHVLVRTVLGRGRFINHWHRPLQKIDTDGLVDSPARSELRNRLLAGHSVVWLLIGSKDREKTDQAKRLAEGVFESLAEKVKLPEGIGLPGSELYADVPLVLKFSLLEIDPGDPKEAFLVRLLTGIRIQAFEDGEPLLVPVFGRGRALEVIPAGDLSARLIEELTLFLSGACSCQVKEQNPGFDLVIDADWDGELFGNEENRPPDRSAQEGQNRDPVLVPIPAGRK
jgi:hypothetical protein